MCGRSDHRRRVCGFAVAVLLRKTSQARTASKLSRSRAIKDRVSVVWIAGLQMKAWYADRAVLAGYDDGV